LIPNDDQIKFLIRLLWFKKKLIGYG